MSPFATRNIRRTPSSVASHAAASHRRYAKLFAAASAGLLFANPSRGATYFWDSTPTPLPSPTLTFGSGPFSTVDQNWWDPINAVYIGWTNSFTDIAQIGGAPGGGKTGYSNATNAGAFTLTLGENISLNTLVVSTVLNDGGAPVTVTNAGTNTFGITLGGTAPAISNNSTSPLLIDVVVSGSAGLTKNNTGITSLLRANNYTGNTTIAQGVLRAVDGIGVPSSSEIIITTGVFDTHGVFTRNLGPDNGTANNNIQITAGGSGFSAAGGSALISLGGLASPTPILWGSSDFNPASVTLNAQTADSPLTFANPLDFGGASGTTITRIITVNTTNGAVTMTGALSNSGGNINFTKAGVGTLNLPNASPLFTGTTTITGGTLALGNDAALGNNTNLNLNNATAVIRSADTNARTIPGLLTVSLSAAIGSSNTGNITFTGGVVTGGGNKVVFINNAVTTFNGTVSGATAPFTKEGPGTLVLANPANPFTKPLIFNAGVVSVGSIANGGVASALGKASNSPASLSFAGGTLQYTGVGDTTDRLFTLGSTSGASLASNTGFIDSSGTGPVNFNNTSSIAFAGTATAHALVLTGSNTGANQLAPSLFDFNGPTSLTKSGPGTWAVTGANGYTGGTFINAGALAISTDSNLGDPASPVTLNGGSLLTSAGFTSTRPFTLGTNGGTLVNTDTVNALILNGNFTGAGGLTKGTNASTVTLGQTSSISLPALTAQGGILNLGDATTGLTSPLAITNLAVNNGARINLVSSPSNTNRVLTNSVNTLSIATNTGAILDIGNHNLFIDATATPPSTVTSYVVTARGTSGAWTGPGLTSSFVAADKQHFAIAVASGTSGVNAINNPVAGKILVRPALIGDANLNGTADNGDISQIIARGHYLDGTSTNAWVDGDFNLDGQVTNGDISLLLASGNYLSGATFSSAQSHALTTATPKLASSAVAPSTTLTNIDFHDTTPDFNYDVQTGDVKIRRDLLPAGQQIGELHIRSASGILDPNQLPDPIVGSNGLDVTRPTEIDLFRLSVTGKFTEFADGYDLGTILPVGLSLSTLLSDITLTYTVKGVSPDNLPSDFIGLPEPSSLALLGLGVGGLLTRRRKAKSLGR